MFRSFFGPGGSQQQPFRSQNHTVRYQLEVTLEDLYNGLTKSILVEQPANGKRKSVQVHIPRGMASGESVILSGEMDHVEDATPGDLVFLLSQRQHPVFTRKGHDLAIEMEITLSEAICGVQGRTIRHLDGRVLTVSSARHNLKDGPPVLIQTGDVHVLKGEGMPKRGEQEGEFGDLYVQYKVEMPSSQAVSRLSPEERDQLGDLLERLEGKHAPKRDKKGESAEPCLLQKASVSDFGRASGPFRTEKPEHTSDRPFAGARSFYWSSSTGGNPFGGGFFGGNPHGSDDSEGADNVQCQQM